MKSSEIYAARRRAARAANGRHLHVIDFATETKADARPARIAVPNSFATIDAAAIYAARKRAFAAHRASQNRGAQ